MLVRESVQFEFIRGVAVLLSNVFFSRILNFSLAVGMIPTQFILGAGLLLLGIELTLWLLWREQVCGWFKVYFPLFCAVIGVVLGVS